VDQGGCIETATRPTTHDDPTYVVHGVTHYAVANMPGAVARTSTFALNNVTVAYGAKIADLGVVKAAQTDRAIARGINTWKGHVTYQAVAHAVGLPYTALSELKISL
jgi:alanine dehydrogenase